MCSRKPVLRGLRKAVPGLLVVDAFEDKVVAEDKPMARAGRAWESTVNGRSRHVDFDLEGRCDLYFRFPCLALLSDPPI
jgi:hypothetical protein